MDIDVQDVWEARVVAEIQIDFTTFRGYASGSAHTGDSFILFGPLNVPRAGIIKTIIQRPDEQDVEKKVTDRSGAAGKSEAAGLGLENVFLLSFCKRDLAQGGLDSRWSRRRSVDLQ